MSQRAYVVVPFERVGITVGAKQVFMFDAPAKAQFAAQQLAARMCGVAVLEREIDPETGDDKDTLIAEFGAIPPKFPAATSWTMRLN